MKRVTNLLQNTTARVIYYSCLSKSRTIPEIAKAWEYRSAAYFYQSNSRKLLKEMVDSKLILTEEIGKGREQLSANYDIALIKPNLLSFFERVNKKIDIELVEEEYPEVTEGQLSDSFFRKYCLNRKPELKERAEKVRFDQRTIENLTLLWEHKFFKHVFLPLESLTSIFHRSELPQDPLELLFGITSALCEKSFELEKGKVFLEPPFIYLFVQFDINDALPPILDQLDQVANPQDNEIRVGFSSLVDRFKQVYNSLKEKILAYGELEDIGSYHIRRFSSMMNLDIMFKRGTAHEPKI